MKTNNVASYTDVLVTCMRQNPKWILLSEVRSAEAVTAVRNSISSGHNILSTIHADKASAIPYRLYSLMETDLDVNQFLSTIYRYIQLGVHIRAYYSKERGQFHREVDEVTEFYVDENNQPQSRIIYQKLFGKDPILRKPSKHLIEYLENQNIDINEITSRMADDVPFGNETKEEKSPAAEETVKPTEPKQETVVPNAAPQPQQVQQTVAQAQPVTVIPQAEPVNQVPLQPIVPEVQTAIQKTAQPQVAEQQAVPAVQQEVQTQPVTIPTVQVAAQVQPAIPQAQQEVVIPTPQPVIPTTPVTNAQGDAVLQSLSTAKETIPNVPNNNQ